jgi:hypothetical protein
VILVPCRRILVARPCIPRDQGCYLRVLGSCLTGRNGEPDLNNLLSGAVRPSAHGLELYRRPWHESLRQGPWEGSDGAVQSSGFGNNFIGDIGKKAFGEVLRNGALAPGANIHLACNEGTEAGDEAVCAAIKDCGRHVYRGLHAPMETSDGRWHRMRLGSNLENPSTTVDESTDNEQGYN